MSLVATEAGPYGHDYVYEAKINVADLNPFAPATLAPKVTATVSRSLTGSGTVRADLFPLVNGDRPPCPHGKVVFVGQAPAGLTPGSIFDAGTGN